MLETNLCIKNFAYISRAQDIVEKIYRYIHVSAHIFSANIFVTDHLSEALTSDAIERAQSL